MGETTTSRYTLNGEMHEPPIEEETWIIYYIVDNFNEKYLVNMEIFTK